MIRLNNFGFNDFGLIKSSDFNIGPLKLFLKINKKWILQFDFNDQNKNGFVFGHNNLVI